MTRVAILRCGKLPNFVTWEIPNLDELFEEDNVLIRSFRAQGFQAEPVVWNKPNMDWNQYDIALIRSTWDYLDDRGQFLHVLSEIEDSSCRLFNSFEVVQWNIDKGYLFDLEAWNVPIIPTFLASRIKSDSLRSSFHDRGWQTVVLKPRIGLGGSHSHRIPLDQLENAVSKLSTSQPEHEFLIQPFIEDILTEGEWSFIYFNRQLSHVLLKKPAENDYRVQGIYGGTIQAAEPWAGDLEQAKTVLARLPFDILYARLDFVRVQGQLAIIEVELIEPIFSFNLIPEGATRLVEATRVRFERTT